MRKGKSIIGKAVLSLDDGVELETVSDVVVDPAGRNVVAIVVTEGGFMSSAKVVPTSEVTSYGKDAIVVRSHTSVISVSDDPTIRAMVDHAETIVGKKVFTDAGDEQGSISDIYFDEPTGEVVGYEVSAGLFGDVAKGTSYLSTDDIVSMGRDVIYVRPETAVTLQAQVGGLQGALQDAGDKLGEVSSSADRDSEAEPENLLIGKRTGSDVESDQGSVIVPKGRRIRSEDVAAAREAGKLDALSASAAAGTAQDVGANASATLGAVGDSAGNLWDQFTAKIGDMTDATGKRADEAQTKKLLGDIADAVGRPVTKVILDREDNVVLNLGDIITHQSIQRAYESGGLDSLLAATYKGNVEFTKEEMRAPTQVEAQATVEHASGGAPIVDELEGKVEEAQEQRDAEKARQAQEADAARERRKKEREARASQREADNAGRSPSESEAPQPVASGSPTA